MTHTAVRLSAEDVALPPRGDPARLRRREAPGALAVVMVKHVK